jgi:hypothetical protein
MRYAPSADAGTVDQTGVGRTGADDLLKRREAVTSSRSMDCESSRGSSSSSERSILAGDSAEERRIRRQEHSRPVLDELREWIDEQRAVVPPKTPLGRALGYLHRQWHRLLLFLEDGNVEMTHHRRERELRRLVLGRRNWLFTWLDLGGDRSASILTIIGSCIAHEVNPRAYVHLVTTLIVQG